MPDVPALNFPVCFWLILMSWSMAAASAQEAHRQSVELGVLGQTTSNKVTAPYHGVEGPSSFSLLGTHHSQIFAGPFGDYTYGITRSLAVEGRSSYLLGKQPISSLSGGNALLVSGGVRAAFGFRGVTFYGRLAPGVVSFNAAGTGITANGYEAKRLTHFTLDEGGGFEVHFAHTNAFRMDLSQILFVEGRRNGGISGGLNYFLPGSVENHLTLTAGLVRYFGSSFVAPISEPSTPLPLRNEVAMSYVWQRQPHLAFTGTYLSSDAGIALSGSHSLARWIGVDASAIVLPGGDTPNYQDGGSEIELLAGVRAGLTRPRYGVFAKYRAGAVSFSSTIKENVAAPSPVRAWDFATDAGGIFEYYPTVGHFVLRLDAGEQYTRYHKVEVKEPPPELTATQSATYTNSPLILVGVGWRF